VMFRIVGDPDQVRRAVRPIERRVAIEQVLVVPPVWLTTVAGFETAVFPYTTDIPFLNRWGQALLFGPGSVHAAHTDHEFIEVAELVAAVDSYTVIARELLARAS
jgi:acetylornithine deacetylase